MRRFLPFVLVLFCLAPTPVAAAVAGDPDCLRTVGGIDLQRATIPQLEQAMATGTLTSQALTKAYLDRIAAYDQGPVKINSIRALANDALAQAATMDAERAAGHRARAAARDPRAVERQHRHPRHADHRRFDRARVEHPQTRGRASSRSCAPRVP